MRKINKLIPPVFFSDFVSKEKPVHWKDCDSEVKKKSNEHMLLNEQNLLCGYTEIYIDNDDCHIDHYIKRSIDNRLCYTWNNLIVAVNDEDFGAKFKDNGPYNVKKNEDYNGILNPVNDIAEDFFQFTLDGIIESKSELELLNSSKANKTIEVFNLNHDSLIDRRKSLALAIKSYKDGGLSNEDIKLYTEGSGFHTCIAYILENYFD